MNHLKSTLAACVTAVAIAGCATDTVPQDAAMVIVTAGSQVPEGLVPATIFEIDGRPVWYKKNRHVLSPGRHTVRVVPTPDWDAESGPDIRLVSAIAAMDTRPLTIIVKPGERYRIAAREVTYRTIIEGDGEQVYKDQWRTTIVPAIL